MRSSLLILILLASLVSTACSYSTDFVVINASDSPIEVSYKIKEPPNGPQRIDLNPLITLAAQLKSKDKGKWKKIEADRYQIDQSNRTVSIKLLPQEALFLTSMFHYFGPDDPNDVSSFPIEELTIAGSAGKSKASGKQLLKAFSEQSKVLFTLSYQ